MTFHENNMISSFDHFNIYDNRKDNYIKQLFYVVANKKSMKRLRSMKL